MKIYFNQVPDSDVEFFGDDGLFGPNDSDNFFYNYVEYGSNPGGLDEVAIYDGCDRQIPLNMEAIPDLIVALEKFYSLHVQARLVEKLNQIALNSEAEAYVEDNEITVNTESFQSALSNTGF
jgi:hypothetical protein